MRTVAFRQSYLQGASPPSVSTQIRTGGMNRWVVSVLLLLLATLLTGSANAQLMSGYYATSCPNADLIVRNAVISGMNSSVIVGPSVLRLFAHDCFVDGCDASIMLVDPAGATERDAPDNQSLQQVSFDTVNQAKQDLEAVCPGVVSCADVLAMAAQDAVNLMGGPSWNVLQGRRDGLTSSVATVAGHLPGSNMDVNALGGIFGAIGLATNDIVALSGAHTVGFSHCAEFTNRLYNFNNVTGASDPSLSANYSATLQGICPLTGFAPSTVQPLDPLTSAQFDNAYYQQLQIGQGLLFSDQVLFVDNTTNNLVTTYANNQGQFFNDFVASMIAMGNAGVLTGTQGEIRLNCSVPNVPVTPPAPVLQPPVITPAPVPPTVVSPPAPVTPPVTPAPQTPSSPVAVPAPPSGTS